MTKAPPQLEKSWQIALEDEWDKPYLTYLSAFIAEERKITSVYPPKSEVFQAFEKTPFNDVKVVIIGQDPYHGEGQAHGLSFSVKPGIALPPSLKNIFKELQEDIGIKTPTHGCLTSWAAQGVLMLNAVLTVRSGQAGSHRGKGWELFTDSVVQKLVQRKDPVIFLLWGRDAQEKCRSIFSYGGSQHAIFISPHPSPFSAHSGFFGSRPFSKINNLLTTQGKKTINWSIE